MELLQGSFSVVMHVAVAVFLLLYLPFSWAWKLVRWAAVRPLLKESVRGKVVLITGASSGIGEELAYEYARRGASLALVARRQEALNAVAKNARERGAPDVIVIAADISSSNESKQVVQQTLSHFGQLNHLVANAGIWSTCIFEEITNIDAFNQVMDVNFWGAVFPTYYAIPHLKNSGGRIIVTASTAGSIPSPRMAFYNASKAAVIRFYETLRQEFGSKIGVTIVNPGYVASELTRGKAVQKNGEVEVNEEARDVQIGPIPVGSAQNLAKKIINGACKGEHYITWPGWYRPLSLVMYVAPEIINFFSMLFLVTKPGQDSSNTLSRKILNMRGIKRILYPASIRCPNTNAETNGRIKEQQ